MSETSRIFDVAMTIESSVTNEASKERFCRMEKRFFQVEKHKNSFVLLLLNKATSMKTNLIVLNFVDAYDE